MRVAELEHVRQRVELAEQIQVQKERVEECLKRLEKYPPEVRAVSFDSEARLTAPNCAVNRRVAEQLHQAVVDILTNERVQLEQDFSAL